MASLELADFGWDQFYHSQLPEDLPPATIPVRVMTVQKSGLHIAAPDIDAHIEVSMVGENCTATTGDWLLFDRETGRIAKRLERKSLFRRRAPRTRTVAGETVQDCSEREEGNKKAQIGVALSRELPGTTGYTTVQLAGGGRKQNEKSLACVPVPSRTCHRYRQRTGIFG
jgi:hypothetical protein